MTAITHIKRVGILMCFFFMRLTQISKEQALAAFEARLESDRLIAYRRQTERLIRRPAEEFRLFIQQVFSPFSGTAWCPTPVAEKPIEKADATASNLK